MRRFLVFAGSNYYPYGGFDDFKGSYKELTEATKAGFDCKNDWFHVVDIIKGKIVFASSWSGE